MNTQIIAIANQKGGVGKTTTCANLGIGLAQSGKKFLLIDGDPQGSLTISLGNPQPDKLPFTLSDAMGRILMDEPIRPGEGILHHPEGVDLMPADIQLSGMEVSLVNAMSRETILRQYLDTLKGQYSHILIDCQPSLGMLTVNALAAANRVIIPVQAEYLPAKGLEQLLQTINKVRRQINPKLQIDGILLTMVDSRTNFAKEISALLRETYGSKIKVFTSEIPHSVRAKEISAEGKSIYFEKLETGHMDVIRDSIENRADDVCRATWDCIDIAPQSIENGSAYIFVNKELQRVTRGALDDLSDKGVIKKFPPCIASTHTALVLKEPKTKTSIRRVYLPKTVAYMLVERKKEIDELMDLFGDEYIDNNLVFCSSNGRPMESQVINRAFNKLIKENGLPHVVFHSLRHSSITYKLKLNGGDMKSVQGDSGHAQVKMVADVYSHIIDEDRCINAQRLEEAFYSSKTPDPVEDTEPKTADTAVTESDESDAAKILELLKNPETAALLKQLAKAL